MIFFFELLMFSALIKKKTIYKINRDNTPFKTFTSIGIFLFCSTEFTDSKSGIRNHLSFKRVAF